MTELNLLLESLKTLDLNKEDKLLIAFSSGPDSAALLVMLKELGYSNLGLAYINYHDSPYVNEEENLVKKFASNYQVELFKNDIDSKSIEKSNFESWAREYRYHYFHQLVIQHNYKAVLVAHHLDDLIETYLIQKTRASLITHYGMLDRTRIFDTDIYRPLLRYTKQDLIDYLNEKNIQYYDDITNANLTRLRNRIRNQVLPKVDKEAIIQEIEEKNRELLSTYQLIESVLKEDRINQNSYKQLSDSSKKRLLYSLLSKCFPLHSYKTISKLTNKSFEFLKRTSSGSHYLIDDYYLYLDETCFYISKYRVKGYYSYVIEKPGVYNFATLKIDLTTDGVFNVFTNSYPITLRPSVPGDTISTKIKTKNVRHFIKSQKVPAYLRDLYPVIVDCYGNIIYVPFYSDLKEHLIPLTLNFIEP